MNPQSIAAPILLVQRLEGMKFRNEPGVKQADLDAAFKAIMDQAPRLAQDRKLTLAAAGAIFQGRSFEANNKGMELLENRLKAFPNDAVTQRIYLNIARGMSTGIGRETAMTVFEQPNLPTSIEALSQQGAREARICCTRSLSKIGARQRMKPRRRRNWRWCTKCATR